MNGTNIRNAHQHILLLVEIDARSVLLTGMIISNKCTVANTTIKPIIALPIDTSR